MISWNINGLNRKLGDIEFINYCDQYDILLLSETWLYEKLFINTKIKGYHDVHIYGNKTNNTSKGRCSGGLSLYFKDYLSPYITLVEKNQIGIMWIKLSKLLFNSRDDVFLCSVYIPPQRSRVMRSMDIDMFDEIERGVEKYTQHGKICIVGDMNSRTATIDDFIVADRYINDDFIDNDDYIPKRKNKDFVLDTYGQKLISLCKSTNIIIANGRYQMDKDIGQHTFCSHKGMSMVDYLLFEKEFLHNNYIDEFDILKFNEFSDHAAVYFTMGKINTTNNPVRNVDKEYKIVYDISKVEYLKNVLSNKAESLRLLSEQVENGEVDMHIEHFSRFVNDNLFPIFKKTC